MKDKVSVIVPIYNVEPYLRKCLDSIVEQTYKNLEIFLIDDGSPDNCGSICDEYAAKDPRIVVVHKANGGLSAARNDGIARATGDWIAFADSDDWCEPDYYEQLLDVDKSKTPDIIYAGGYYLDWPAKRKAFHTFNRACSYTGREQIEDLQADIVHCGLPWDKLYKAAFLKENGFRFASDIRAFEDFLFNFQVLAKARSVVTSPAIGYHYRQVQASIANGFNPNKPQVNYEYLTALHNCLNESNVSEKLREGMNAAAICAISVALNCYYFHPANKKNHEKIDKEIEEMLKLPYYQEAIYSPSNRYLSKRQRVLKYTLKKCGGGVSFGPCTQRRNVSSRRIWPKNPEYAALCVLPR